MTKPSVSGVSRAVLRHVIFRVPFMIVMHGPGSDWVSWSGNRFRRMLEIRRYYSKIGYK